MKLSKVQQRVIDFMREHDTKVYISRHPVSTHVFFLGEDRWQGRRPSLATIHKLVDLGLIVREDGKGKPWYREDYRLADNTP